MLRPGVTDLLLLPLHQPVPADCRVEADVDLALLDRHLAAR